jgi:hypothetical protein
MFLSGSTVCVALRVDNRPQELLSPGPLVLPHDVSRTCLFRLEWRGWGGVRDRGDTAFCEGGKESKVFPGTNPFLSPPPTLSSDFPAGTDPGILLTPCPSLRARPARCCCW